MLGGDSFIQSYIHAFIHELSTLQNGSAPY